MKQRIFTACGFNKGDPIAAAPAGVDTVYTARSAGSDARLSWVLQPWTRLDASADKTTVKACIAMSAACEIEAEHRPISPSDKDGCSTLFEPAPAMLTVLRAAVQVEPDPVEAGFWYRRTCIAELGGLTAAQLVSQGRGAEVIGFLLSVRDGKRDGEWLPLSVAP